MKLYTVHHDSVQNTKGPRLKYLPKVSKVNIPIARVPRTVKDISVSHCNIVFRPLKTSKDPLKTRSQGPSDPLIPPPYYFKTCIPAKYNSLESLTNFDSVFFSSHNILYLHRIAHNSGLMLAPMNTVHSQYHWWINNLPLTLWWDRCNLSTQRG